MPMFLFLEGAKISSLPHKLQTGPGAHLASYPVGTGSSFPWEKRPTCEGNRSHPSKEEVKNCGDILPVPHMSSWVVIKLIKHRENFAFTFNNNTNINKESLCGGSQFRPWLVNIHYECEICYSLTKIFYLK
jgi:hypothetical protein